MDLIFLKITPYKMSFLAFFKGFLLWGVRLCHSKQAKPIGIEKVNNY